MLLLFWLFLTYAYLPCPRLSDLIWPTSTLNRTLFKDVLLAQKSYTYIVIGVLKERMLNNSDLFQILIRHFNLILQTHFDWETFSLKLLLDDLFWFYSHTICGMVPILQMSQLGPPLLTIGKVLPALPERQNVPQAVANFPMVQNASIDFGNNCCFLAIFGTYPYKL